MFLNSRIVKCPIYIFHGSIDKVISYENSIRLKVILKPNDKLFRLENQGHLGVNNNEMFQSKLKEILK